MGLQRVIHDWVSSLSFPPWSWESRYFYDIVSSFSLDIFPAVELLDHIVVLFSVFWGNFILFFRVATSVHQKRQWQPTPVLLPRKSHGQRSLVGCSPWGREDSDTTEQLHFHTFHFHALEKEMQPTPVFLPGESQGWRRLVGCRLWGCTEVGHDWSDLAAAAASIHNLTNNAQAFSFLHTLISIHYLLSLWWQPLEQIRGNISLWFQFAFPND